MASDVVVKCAVCASVFAGAAAHAQNYIEVIPLPPGRTQFTVDGISADGSTVMGHSNGPAAYRYRRGIGHESIGTMLPHGITNDGNQIFGHRLDDTNFVPVRWTPQGTSIIPVPGVAAIVEGASPDGYVTMSGGSGFSSRGYIWHGGPSSMLIPPPTSNAFNYANDVSNGGTVVVGEYRSTAASDRGMAFVWTVAGGSQALPEVVGATYSAGLLVTPDGSVAVGMILEGGLTHTARWDLLGGGVTLLPGIPGNSTSTPWGVSDDGRVIVGIANPSFGYIYTPELGFLPATQYLAACGLNMTGWTIPIVHGVSGDGLTFVGEGTFQGVARSWIAHVPSAGTGGVLLMGILAVSRRLR